MICGTSSWTDRVPGAGTRRWGRLFTAGKISSSSTRRCAAGHRMVASPLPQRHLCVDSGSWLAHACPRRGAASLVRRLPVAGSPRDRTPPRTPPAQGSGRHISMVRSLVPRLSQDVALPLSVGHCAPSSQRRLGATSGACCCRCTRRPPRDPRTMWRLYQRKGLRGRGKALLAPLSETILARTEVLGNQESAEVLPFAVRPLLNTRWWAALCAPDRMLRALRLVASLSIRSREI